MKAQRIAAPGPDILSQSHFPDPPLRHPSIVGHHVLSHSGEYAPAHADFSIACMASSIAIVRCFRQRQVNEPGLFGAGWSLTTLKRIRPDGDDILLEDGWGRLIRFARNSSSTFSSPSGIYALATVENGVTRLAFRHGWSMYFEDATKGGRLLKAEGRHFAELLLTYERDAIHIRDGSGNALRLLIKDERVTSIDCNQSGRLNYSYDARQCLTEVTGRTDSDDKPKVLASYEYDNNQLISLAYVSDQSHPLLIKRDKECRVVCQRLGTATTRYRYSDLRPLKEEGHPTKRVYLYQKNQSAVILDHDKGGRLVRQVVLRHSSPPRTGGVSSVQRAVTRMAYNTHGEMVKCSQPDGQVNRWAWDDLNTDPRARGNMLRATRMRPGAKPDRALFRYDQALQLVDRVARSDGRRIEITRDDRGCATARLYYNKYDRQSGARETYKYDSRGRVVSCESSRTIKRFTYSDAAGPEQPCADLLIGIDEVSISGTRTAQHVSLSYGGTGHLKGARWNDGRIANFKHDGRKLSSITINGTSELELGFSYGPSGTLRELGGHGPSLGQDNRFGGILGDPSSFGNDWSPSISGDFGTGFGIVGGIGGESGFPDKRGYAGGGWGDIKVGVKAVAGVGAAALGALGAVTREIGKNLPPPYGTGLQAAGWAAQGLAMTLGVVAALVPSATDPPATAPPPPGGNPPKTETIEFTDEEAEEDAEANEEESDIVFSDEEAEEDFQNSEEPDPVPPVTDDYPNPDDGDSGGGPAGMPNPEGGGPMGPAYWGTSVGNRFFTPRPDGEGPQGPLLMPAPDSGDPGSPVSINASLRVGSLLSWSKTRGL